MLSNQFLYRPGSQTYYLNNERRDLITARNVENFAIRGKTWELFKWKNINTGISSGNFNVLFSPF